MMHLRSPRGLLRRGSRGLSFVGPPAFDTLTGTAELDYAFLADFAQIADGKLTAVGASFTVVTGSEYPRVLPLRIAGRIRTTVEEPSVDLSIAVKAPAEKYSIDFDAQVAAGDDLRPYADGKLGLLFAFPCGYRPP